MFFENEALGSQRPMEHGLSDFKQGIYDENKNHPVVSLPASAPALMRDKKGRIFLSMKYWECY